MTLHIYDSMAVFRRALDTDPLGRGPRKLVWNALAASPKDVHVYVFEGKGAKAMRRRLYPGYKERPSTMSDSFFDVVKVIRAALLHTSAMQISQDGFEGDDVIAALAQKYAGKVPVEIHSVDRDLHQLGVIPGVKVRVSPFTKKIKDQYGKVIDTVRTVEDRHVRLYKTYVGDPSDKIPGLAGFGEKSWEEIDKDKLLAAHQGLVRNDPRVEEFMAAGCKEPTAARICEKRTSELLRNFWLVVGFLPLPGGWEEDMIIGKVDKMAADLLLKEHRQ